MEGKEDDHRPKKMHKKEKTTKAEGHKQNHNDNHSNDGKNKNNNKKDKNVDAIKQQKKHDAKKTTAQWSKKTKKDTNNNNNNNKNKSGFAVHIHGLPFRLAKTDLEKFLSEKKIKDVSITHMERLTNTENNNNNNNNNNVKSKTQHWASYKVVVPTKDTAAAIVSLFNHHNYNKNPEEHYLFGRTAFPFLQHYFPSLLSATLMTVTTTTTDNNNKKEKEKAPKENEPEDLTAVGESNNNDTKEEGGEEREHAATTTEAVPVLSANNKKKNKFKTYKPHTALVIADGAVPITHRWRDIKSAIGHIISGNTARDSSEREAAHGWIKNGIELIKLCENTQPRGENENTRVHPSFYEKAFLICKTEEAREKVLEVFQQLENQNSKFDAHVAYLKRARPSTEEEEVYIQQKIESWRSAK